MKRSIVVVLLGLLSLGVSAQKSLNKIVPPDEQVRIGRLSNGMMYYIRANKHPEARASYYLVSNAGALLERDSQQGLAHFLEHMAFNGTKFYPGKKLIEMMERHGVKFGENINAYTQQDETVYNLSDVPTTTEPLIDSTLMALHDWSYYITLDSKEIDDERGVILEEKRTRGGAQARIRNQIVPVIFNNSQYAKRDVIGTDEILKTFNPDTLRKFYHDWYRTDLQAIIIVGDFNAGAMERKVIELFSKIPPAKNPMPRPEFAIKDNDTAMYVAATDKELSSPSISISFRKKLPESMPTEQALRDDIIENLFNTMMQQRISDVMKTEVTPFLGLNIGISELVRGYGTYSISITPKAGYEKDAVRKAFEINEKVRRYGFNQDEVDRAVTNAVIGFQNYYQQKDKRENESFINDYKNNFLLNTPMPDIEFTNTFYKKTWSGLSAKDVSAQMNEWYTHKNMTIVVTGSGREKLLSKADVMQAIAEVEGSKNLDKLKSTVSNAKLFDLTVKSGNVVSKSALPMFNAEEWTLSNGAKVVYKKNTFNTGQIVFFAKSSGGLSLISSDDLPSAQQVSGIFNYGLGKHDNLTLQQLLTGKSVNVGVNLSGRSENISGVAEDKDAETLMQMVHLLFVAPRFDSLAHNLAARRAWDALKQRVATPQQIIQDSVTMIINSYSPRLYLYNEDFLNKISLKKIESIFRDRYQDASEFTFYIVGDIGKDKVMALVEKYIASLPSNYRKETAKDLLDNFPKGVIKKTIEVPIKEKKAFVVISIKKDMPFSYLNKNLLDIMSSALQLRLTEEVREKAGGTYGVNISLTQERSPKGIQGINLQFECDPARVEELKKIVYAEIKKIEANGVTEDDFKKAIAEKEKNYQQIEKDNGYWMGVLQAYYAFNENIDSSELNISLVKKITMNDVKNYAQMWFKNTDQVELTFVPKAN